LIKDGMISIPLVSSLSLVEYWRECRAQSIIEGMIMMVWSVAMSVISGPPRKGIIIMG